MSARISGENFEDYISQAQAARIRAVTRQAIGDLIKRGRLRSVSLAGRTLVLRSEVEHFIELAKGRPLKNAIERKTPGGIRLSKEEIRQA
jgi:hypothetical protein